MSFFFWNDAMRLCVIAYRQLAACSVGWWLMAGAGLFWEKSTAGWLLVAGLFWEKNTAGWLVADKSSEQGVGIMHCWVE
jgi:hypothetical protein